MTSSTTNAKRKFKRTPLDQFNPHPMNAKTHDVPMIVESIEHNGFFQVIGVQASTDLMVFGHGRVEAAQIVRAKIVAGDDVGGMPARDWVKKWGTDLRALDTEVLDVDDATALRILAVDNESTIAGGIDNERLHALLAEIGGDDPIERLRGSGYTPSDPARLLKELAASRNAADVDDVETPIDMAAVLQVEWATEPGQVWSIASTAHVHATTGEPLTHRMMIGDARDPDAPSRLLDGKTIDLLVTSPPYNVGIDYGRKGDDAAHDDESSDWARYGTFLAACLAPWLPHVIDGGCVAWNVGVSRKTFHARQLVMLEDVCGLTFQRQIVWQKVGTSLPVVAMMRKAMRARTFTPNYSHEVIYLLSKGETFTPGGDLDEIDALTQYDVMQINQAQGTRDVPDGDRLTGAKSATKGVGGGLERRALKAHPAVYPARVPGVFISHMADIGAVVFDPYLGAGTTIIAAEQRRRAGYGIEQDPGYAAVALHRCAALGMVPTLEG